MKNTKYYSPKRLFQILAADPNMKRIASIYDAYLYFSKYDHFGIMYYEIIRMDKDEKQRIYLKAFEGLIANMTFLFVILDKTFETDEFVKEIASIANDYFLKMLAVGPQTDANKSMAASEAGELELR